MKKSKIIVKTLDAIKIFDIISIKLITIIINKNYIYIMNNPSYSLLRVMNGAIDPPPYLVQPSMRQSNSHIDRT